MTLLKSLPQATTGDERAKLLKLLGSTLSDSRFTTASRILAKDPTLSNGAIIFGGERVPFVKACLHAGFLRGIDVARSCGLDVNAFLGNITLLDIAIGRGDVSAVDHLLFIGADANLAFDDGRTPGNPPLSKALVAAVTLNKANRDFGIPRLLMDAGASIHFPEHLDPAAFVIASASWKDREVEMARLLADCKARGASMDARSTKSKVTPLRLCLGAKNVQGAIAFLHLGASFDEASLGGDLIEIAISNKLDEHVPEIQAAVMARSAREARAAMEAAIAAGQANDGGTQGNEPARNRRHVPSL